MTVKTIGTGRGWHKNNPKNPHVKGSQGGKLSGVQKMYPKFNAYENKKTGNVEVGMRKGYQYKEDKSLERNISNYRYSLSVVISGLQKTKKELAKLKKQKNPNIKRIKELENHLKTATPKLKKLYEEYRENVKKRKWEGIHGKPKQ